MEIMQLDISLENDPYHQSQVDRKSDGCNDLTSCVGLNTWILDMDELAFDVL